MYNLQACDAEIKRRGERLRIIAPIGCLSESLKREIRKNKKELLKLLNPHPSLLEYIEILDDFQPAETGDLPPVPPFKWRPERRVAWSAWWDAVEKGRSRP